jgi:hypothetical protein
VRLAKLSRVVFSVSGLKYAALLAVLVALGGGEAFSAIEKASLGEGVYWAVTTMTTVGYGDLSPETDAGKVLAVGVMLCGIGFVAVLTGAVAERFLAQDVGPIAGQVEALADAEALRGHAGTGAGGRASRSATTTGNDRSATSCKYRAGCSAV